MCSLVTSPTGYLHFTWTPGYFNIKITVVLNLLNSPCLTWFTLTMVLLSFKLLASWIYPWFFLLLWSFYKSITKPCYFIHSDISYSVSTGISYSCSEQNSRVGKIMYTWSAPRSSQGSQRVISVWLDGGVSPSLATCQLWCWGSFLLSFPLYLYL